MKSEGADRPPKLLGEASTDLECIRCAHTMESIEEGGELVVDGLVEKEVRVQANKLWRDKGEMVLVLGRCLGGRGFPIISPSLLPLVTRMSLPPGFKSMVTVSP